MRRADRADVARAAEAAPPLPGDVQTVAALILRRAEQFGDREAVVDQHHRLDVAAVEHQSAKWAAALAARGLAAGDRVAVSLPNGVPIVLAFLAAMRLGLVWVGVNRVYTPVEKRGLLADCGARLLLTDRDLLLPDADAAGAAEQIDVGSDSFAVELASAPPVADADVDPFAPAAIAYTSGTTGVPKGAVHSQRNLLLPGVVAQMRGDGAGVIGMYLPMTSLNMQVLGTVYALVNGECLVCIPRSDALTVVAAVQRERIVRLSASPTTVHDLVRNTSVPADALASLTALTLGGAPTNDALEPAFRARFGHRFLSGYGLTEAPASVTRERPDAPHRSGSAGPPLPQYGIDIVDDAGVVLAAGEVGEICVRAASDGPLAGVYTPMLGYWNRPEATAAALRDGRLHTGDIGWLDADGDLHVEDRRVDLIVRGGSNVYPAEVERVLLADPRIADCAVVARPDERLGQLPVAFVQATTTTGRAGAGLTAADVRDIAAASLASFKVPVAVVLVDDFPRNQMGKILRTELRSRAAALHLPPRQQAADTVAP